ncbi:hypothetical protein ABIE67_000484 [Streptomyces sp. V4I8]
MILLGSEGEAVGEGGHEVVHGAFPAEGAGAADAAFGDGTVAVDVAAFDAADAEVEEFDGGVVAGEVAARLGDLAELVVQGFDGVGREAYSRGGAARIS